MSLGALVIGVLYGLTYGMLAIGLVLVYKSNRFLNLAHGQMGALSSAILAKLVLDHGWNWWLAFAVCVPLGVLVGVVVDRWIIRPLREQGTSSTTLMLVTIGITLVMIGISLLSQVQANPNKLGTEGYPVPFRSHLHLGGVFLSGADIFTAAAVPVIVLALAMFLRSTKLGRSIRAAASNPDEARLCGISARYVSMVTWAIAGGLSAVTAIIQGPSLTAAASATLGPYLLFLALGAAAFAAFTSIPLAMAGGVVIGVVQQLASAATHTPSDGELAAFLVIVAMILLRGRAIGHAFAVTGAPVEERAPLRLTQPASRVGWIRHRNQIGVALGASLALLLPAIPVFSSGSQRFHLALITAYALTALSLTIAVGWAGQVSLGQFALVGAGAFIASRLFAHGWSVPFAVVPVGLVGAGIMLAIGIPALRVPGLTITVTTLGFAIVGQDWLYRQGWFGTPDSAGISFSAVRPPLLLRGLGRPTGFLVVYYFGCLLIALSAILLTKLRRSQPGRVLIAVRDNSAAAAAFGVRPATAKMLAMALSGFLAGAAGVVWAYASLGANPALFSPQVSLVLLALPVIGGLGSVGGAILAAVVFYAFNFFAQPHLQSIFGTVGGNVGFQTILGGLGIVATVLFKPAGMAGAAQDWMQRRIDRVTPETRAEVERPEKPPLLVEDVVVRFGGIHALNYASLEVRPGEIVGLIGPNGAGKTTLLNVISGALRADEGRVYLGRVDLTDLPPELRSAYGLARSFQNARLFPGLTVVEALQVACYNRFRPSLMAAATGAPWVRSAESENLRGVDEVIDRLGLRPFAGRLTAELSTGTRRICDLAAQLVARPSVLLLDEPTGGVAQREAEAFGPLLRRIRDELECSVLIIEHDMPLLMGLCDRVYAMELGTVIASGTPEEVRDDPRVIASYLGTDEVAAARSGRAVATVERPAKKKSTRRT
jgi:ABC-type branched-subunit amino acid transport system ATPase component/branched-subunit amino acid ABC-type transport system permease component